MAFPPFSLPQLAVQIDVIHNGHRTMSPYSFAQTAYDFMGGMWAARVDLSALNQRDSARFLGWIASLDGPFGTFELRLADYSGPFGTVTANPTIAAIATARAKSISLDVAPGDALVADDRITIAGHMHVVTAAAAPVADVQAVDIWPRLRADVAVADPVEALVPYATWALANQRNGLRMDVALFSNTSLDLIEAL